MHNVCVVLPAYNEAPALRRLIPRILAVGHNMPWRLRGIVVDDGSQDETAAVIRNVKGWECIRHQCNQGLGAAINTGLCAAMRVADAVVVMDADDTHDPRCIPALVGALERKRWDVAVASRFIQGARVSGVPITRRIVSWGANTAMRVAVGRPGLTDYSSGYRAFRTGLLEAIASSQDERVVADTGFSATVELLLTALAWGATVGEIPIELAYERKPTRSAMNVSHTLLGGMRCYWRLGRAARSATRKNGSSMPA
ncbi:MAG: glycosyltransferase [Gemmatimonadaceae bacterium]